jgi:hypothetical protein
MTDKVFCAVALAIILNLLCLSTLFISSFWKVLGGGVLKIGYARINTLLGTPS